MAKKAKVNITPPNCESTPDKESVNFLNTPLFPLAIAQVTKAPRKAPINAVLMDNSNVFLKACRVETSEKVFFKICRLGLPETSLNAPKIT